MSWEKVQLGSFLETRNTIYKYDDKSISKLKRIDKIDFTGKIYLSEKSSKTNMILIKKGDLVISGINVEKGAMSIYEGDEDIKATIHYSSYIYNKEKIDIDFLKLFLQSTEFKKAIKEQVPGGIKTEIKPRHLLPLYVEIPNSIEEQKDIANIIQSNFQKINNLEKEHIYQLNLIKKIRQKILQDAIQGKLVSQNEDDEPASKLLKRIKTEKERLIKEKIIKKEKPLPSISTEDIPFTIPNSWEWCRLGDICSKIGSGSTPKGGNYTDKGFPFFRSQNIYDYRLDLRDIKYITTHTHDKMRGTIVLPNDLLLNITGGSLGRCSIVPKDIKEGNVSQHVCIIRPILSNNHFIHDLILSPYFQSLIFSSTTGAGREGLPKYNLELFSIPLPPLVEQQRIVERVDELMTICDQLEKSITQNKELSEKLYQSALKEALQPRKAKMIEFTPKFCDSSMRAIIAGYILNQCHTEDDGRVKFMKLLYLVEHACQFDFNSQYVKQTAGPYDDNLIKDVEHTLKRFQFYEIEQNKRGNKKVKYTKLGSADNLNTLFAENFVEEQQIVDSLLSKFKNKTWEHAEIVATLYAVWNNRNLEGKLVNDALLQQDFLEWDKNKAKYKDRLSDALEWMRNNHIIPTEGGYGKIIERP